MARPFGILNVQKPPIRPEDHFVCPVRPLYSEHHGFLHPNFITVQMKQQAYSLTRGDIVQLKERRRLVEGKFVTKPVGPARSILAIRDHIYNSDFDKAAFQIPVGELPPCSAFPAHHSLSEVKIAEGTFPISIVQKAI